MKEIKVLAAREVILFCDLPLGYDATRKKQLMLFSGGTGKNKEKYALE